jgi:hypothetical protein
MIQTNQFNGQQLPTLLENQNRKTIYYFLLFHHWKKSVLEKVSQMNMLI